MAQLNVEFTANVDKLTRNLDKAENALADFEKKAQGTQAELTRLAGKEAKLAKAQERLNQLYKEGKISVDRYRISNLAFNKSLEQTISRQKSARTSLAGYGKNIRDLGGSFGKTRNTAGAANQTLQEFSRVIQDAPFGIQGVGNNITQLTSAFGNLSRGAGGAGAALKILGGSFLGPAGILFAVSTAVSLLTVFGDSLFKSGDAAESLADRLGKIDGKFQGSLDLNKEITRNLELQGQSTEGIRKQRIAILKAKQAEVLLELQQNQNRLTALKLQNSTLSTWETITQIAKIFGQQVLREIQNRLGFINDAIALAVGIFQANTKGLRDAGTRAGLEAATAAELEEQAALTEEVRQNQAAALALSNDILDVEKSITEERKKQAKGPGLTPSAAKLSNSGLSQFSILGDKQLALEEAAAKRGNQIITKYVNGITQKFRDANRTIQEEGLSPVQRGLNQLNENFLNAFEGLKTGAIVDGVTSAFQSLAGAIANGGDAIGAIGQSILQSFGQFISNFGKQLLLYGLGAKAFSLASKGLTNPLTALPSAGAAIAAGIALSAAGAAISAIGSGGLGGSAVSGQGGGSFSGSSSSFTGGFQGGNGTVTFEIQGRKLVGVLNNELRATGKTVSNLI